jgi:hypothetical protein
VTNSHRVFPDVIVSLLKDRWKYSIAVRVSSKEKMVRAVRTSIQRTHTATEIPARQTIACALCTLRCALAESNISQVTRETGRKWWSYRHLFQFWWRWRAQVNHMLRFQFAAATLSRGWMYAIWWSSVFTQQLHDRGALRREELITTKQTLLEQFFLV